MSNYIVDSADLTSVADAIRTKGGTSAQLAFPVDFVTAIGNISGGGGYTGGDFGDFSKPTGAIVVDATYSTDDASQEYNVLQNRTGITDITFSNATRLQDGFCDGCSNLERIKAPNATILGANGLRKTKIVNAVFEKVHSIYTNCFSGCSQLEAVDLGGSPASGQGLFRNSIFGSCSKLATLVLRGSTVWPLTNINVFTGTPFASGKSGGTLYVPQALISGYKAATNWSTILGYANNQILPIEGSIYETQYVDGTPIPTT